MKWSKHLKRGCAVAVTAALLAGGVNWYVPKLKAVSSLEQTEFAALDGQEGQIEAGGYGEYSDR